MYVVNGCVRVCESVDIEEVAWQLIRAGTVDASATPVGLPRSHLYEKETK